MEIEGYVLGPHYLWGQVLGCQQPLLGQGLLPLLPTCSPHSQWTKQRKWVIDIKWYALGSSPPVGPIFGVPTTSLEPKVPPLVLSSLPSLTIDWAEVGHNGDRGYVLGSPPLVGVSFGMPITSVGPRVPPSSLPLAPLAPSCSPCSLLLPLLPLAPLAPSCSSFSLSLTLAPLSPSHFQWPM